MLSTCYASAHDFEVDGIYYKKTASYEVAVTYEGDSYNQYSDEYSGTVTIPSEVTYFGTTYKVTLISEKAFEGCKGLTSITIPNSVTSIGDGAFYGCYHLTSVAIPNSVTSIGSSAFSWCIGLKSVTIPNSVTEIGDYAFYNCTSLTSITIPNSVTSIGSDAFKYCTSLPVIDNIRYADTYLIGAIDKTLSSYTIKKGTRFIGSSAFENCSGLTSITIPNSVTSIGSSAFENCSGLTSITIPNSVTSIGSEAFSGCTSLPVFDNLRYADTYLIGAIDKTLSSYTIKKGTRFIGSSAFENCSGLTSITIPNSVTSIGNYAFEDCAGLTSITIPNSVTSIGGGAFENCRGLTSITIPNSVTSIGSSAFFSCTGLTSVTIPNGVTTIGIYAFYYCSGLKSVTIPNSVTSIGISAFYNCSGLTSITIPNSVTSIGNSAFDGCTGLTSITIPNSVTSIGDQAFYNCINLTTLNYNAKKATVSTNTSFSSFPRTIKTVNIGDDVQSIPESFLYRDDALTSVTIPNSVTSIGEEAFSGCSGLTSVTIGNSVTSIGDDAFYDCYGLTSITIGNSVTSIGQYAFYGCTNLTTLNYNAKNATVSTEASSPSFPATLKSVFIGDVVQSIPSCFLYGDTALTSIIIPNSVTDIGDNAFMECTNLQNVTCKNPTPPSVYSTSFSTYGTLYVPFISKSKYASNSIWSKFTIKTLPVPAPVTSLKFENDRVEIREGASKLLRVLYSPAEPTVKTLEWSSSDNNIATVSSDGVVYAKKSGTAIITAKTTDDTDISAACTIKVLSDYLWMKDVSVTLHEKAVSYPIYMENSVSISNLQFDLELPKGIDVAYEMNEDEEEDYVITKGERAKTAHSVSVQKNGEHNYRVTISSTSNATFKDEDKTLPVAYVKLDCSKVPAVSTVDCKIYLKNMVLAHDENGKTTKYTVDADSATLKMHNVNKVTFISDGKIISEKMMDCGEAITLPDAPEIDGYAFITWGDVASTVPTHDVTYTAEYVMIGDVITDGKLNIGDLTKLVGEILKNEGPSLDVRSFKKSDVLVDNTIDLGDYTRLVGKVLDADSVKGNAEASNDYGFSMKTTPDASDKTKSMLDVFMTNKETISAIQFDVCLSGNADVYYGKNADGDMAYLISKGERAKTNHAVSFKKLADGTYRVIVSSPKNDTFKETEANKTKPVASLTLDVSNVTAGTPDNVEIKNVVLSHYDTTDGSVQMYYPQDISYSLNATTKGDVTGNGTVDKEDVDAVINVICGGEEFKDAADVNGDGKVDVNDVNTVIGTICGGK